MFIKVFFLEGTLLPKAINMLYLTYSMMISQKQIDEIRKYLDSAENPLFIWDGDTDGLCSFLLLRRYTGKGSYIIARDSPEAGVDLVKQVNEASPDRVFVLDQNRASPATLTKTHRLMKHAI